MMSTTPGATMLMFLNFDWNNISGGQILVLVSVLTAIYAFPKRISRDTLDQWKGLAEGYKEERDKARERLTELGADYDLLKQDDERLKIELAKCQERPSVDQLAQAITALQEGFSQRGDDILHTQNRILAHLEKTTLHSETTAGAIKSMEQALRLVADRLQSDATERRLDRG